MKKPSKKEWSLRRFMIVFGAMLLVAAIGCDTLWVFTTNRFWHGELRDAFVTSAGVVGVVGVLHSGKGSGSYDYRLTLIDPASGECKARTVLGGGEPRCAELRAGGLWCRCPQRLLRLSTASLEVVADWADLQRALPELSAGLYAQESELRVVGGALLLTTNGRRSGRPMPSVIAWTYLLNSRSSTRNWAGVMTTVDHNNHFGSRET